MLQIVSFIFIAFTLAVVNHQNSTKEAKYAPESSREKVQIERNTQDVHCENRTEDVDE